MNEIIVRLDPASESVVFLLSTASGEVPVLLGLLVDESEAEHTIWGVTPAAPHFEHPLQAALAYGVPDIPSPLLHAALNLTAEGFSQPLSSVTFGVAPPGFVSNQPDDAVGLPQLVPGRNYVVTAMGLSGLGFMEFTAPHHPR